MNFLKERCLFQTLLLSQCMQKKEKEIFRKLLLNYALNKKDKRQIEHVLADGTFCRIYSADGVTLHQNYLRAFCTDKNEFGNSASEWDALEIKRNAYGIFEQLSGGKSDFHDILSAAANKSDSLTVTLALYYYLSSVKSEVFLPLLRRAEGHGNCEAAILLMSFESERKQAIYEKLMSNKELLTYNDDTLTLLATNYKIGNLGEVNKK